ncbi:MAG: hypothetical protein AAGG01_10990, partial [Planctomycetota bacterium]
MQQRGPRFAMEMVVATTPAAFDETKTDGQGRFSLTSHSELITTYYATVTSRDGARCGVAVIQPGPETVTISLEEIDDRDGAVEIELPGRFQGLPVDLTTDGTPGEPFLLRPGTPLTLEDLTPGAWRVTATWRGETVVKPTLVNVEADGTALLTGALPTGAIQGQTAEVRERAIAAREVRPERYLEGQR